MKDGSLGICLKTRSERAADVFVAMTWVKFIETHNAQAYHEWIFELEAPEMPIDIDYGVLFLPRLCPAGFVTEPKAVGHYTVIGEEWVVLSEDREFVSPEFPTL